MSQRKIQLKKPAELEAERGGRRRRRERIVRRETHAVNENDNERLGSTDDSEGARAANESKQCRPIRTCAASAERGGKATQLLVAGVTALFCPSSQRPSAYLSAPLSLSIDDVPPSERAKV